MILIIAVRQSSLLAQCNWTSHWKLVFWVRFRRVCFSCRFISWVLSNNKNRERSMYLICRSKWFTSSRRLIISLIIPFLSLKWLQVQNSSQRQLFCSIKSMRVRCVVLREGCSRPVTNWLHPKIHLIWIWLNLTRRFRNISRFPSFRLNFCRDRLEIPSFLPSRHLLLKDNLKIQP